MASLRPSVIDVTNTAYEADLSAWAMEQAARMPAPTGSRT
ncbi:hypothetical protein J2X36_002797 [Methylobacterium sp. BE186]|nr:hypothetical protein [Methylobacterium sp. BE186]